MYRLLEGMRVVEGASFVAAPSAALHLSQLGADVIRFDQIGGGPDFRRWPLAPNGLSYYWEGLNKGKKSIAIDLRTPRGQALASDLVTAPGEAAGLFVTNFPEGGFLSHAALSERRPDLITARVLGWADGAPALDYTVNAAVGVPFLTGPAALGNQPVNHVLPAWDIATGLHAAMALLAAERHRSRTGEGGEIRIPLGDVAMATLGFLGQVAEVSVTGTDRPRYGNDTYGTFGRDFLTRDGRPVMVMAMTPRQWRSLVDSLGIAEPVAALEADLGLDLGANDGLRFTHRERLFPLVAAAIASHSEADLARHFAGTAVCWAPYQTLREALGARSQAALVDPLLAPVSHPTGDRYPTPGSPVTVTAMDRLPPVRAPSLGEHTDEILADVLGLPDSEIGHLHDDGTVAGPSKI
ncbi:MAG: CoA transferase [Rhodospirillum sp.]|nr:CoA transferase [Rhodospirillum sp.]MCF8490579.1 CoA transferase [Rhodospirillum sp.]MCF8502591.1 CoA transferase [Rhodospirillum sp.]